MHPELFMPADRYALEVRFLTKVLRRTHKDLDHRRSDIHAALRIANFLDLGDMAVFGGYVAPEWYGDLVEELANQDPDIGTGEFEEHQVRFVLGEFGNIWPDTIKADVMADRAREAERKLERERPLALLD